MATLIELVVWRYTVSVSLTKIGEEALGLEGLSTRILVVLRCAGVPFPPKVFASLIALNLQEKHLEAKEDQKRIMVQAGFEPARVSPCENTMVIMASCA